MVLIFVARPTMHFSFERILMKKPVPQHAPSGTVLHLPPDKLRTHPRNLRRFYPDNQVQEMAMSIKSNNGVYQSMLVVPNCEAGCYFVVDGNVRLAGGRLLGAECPPLKCEVVDQSEAEQLLTMAVTARFRYRPDPISEALHYQRLIEEEEYTVPRIAAESGIARTIIDARLKLLLLDQEIQELIAKKELPSDKLAVTALLTIPDSAARIRIALRLARDHASIPSIVSVCSKVIEKMGGCSQKTGPGRPPKRRPATMSELAGRLCTQMKGAVPWKSVKDSFSAVCAVCDLRTGALRNVPDPGWALVMHAGQDLCGGCEAKAVKGACGQCPTVEFLQKLIDGAKQQ